MGRVEEYDAIVVGGGPAGSSCARVLAGGGMRVAVLDRARFPRVKLCAGWISEPVWDVLELSPREYPRGLWPWDRCHVHFQGVDHTVDVNGWFIRRYEFDEFLLERAGAEVRQGVSVDAIERDGDGWLVNGGLRARYLIGAGGTTCPVARSLFRKKPESPVGVQEHEFEVGATPVAACRAGLDGEPELLLHGDLRGYSWNIPKTSWLNVGCGTMRAREVRAAWRAARDHFTEQGHLPAEAAPGLDHMAGWSYYLFDPRHLDDAERDGAVLVGDALGLAQPLTAEGILPSVLSGRLAGEAILAGEPARYPRALRRHPIIRDYDLLWRLRLLKGVLPKRNANGNGNGARRSLPAPVASASKRAVATGFAWLFAGRKIPGGRALGPIIGTVGKLLEDRRS